jgi:creatinine amidohydrolase
MSGRPYVLAETTYKTVLQTGYEVAILPWGACEAHNYHLPYATDNVEAERTAIEAARLAWERDARVTVLPTIPFGVNTQQTDIPLTINMNPTTQVHILNDVIKSLEPHSVRKLVIFNFHGGNNFKQMIRQAQANTSLFVCTVDGHAVVPMDEYFQELGDHANEMETSLLMHLTPDLVLPLSEAGPGSAKQFKVPAFRQGWAWAPREWTQVTTDTGVGNPAAASAEKGEAYFGAVTEKVADFLVDLAAADPGEMYQ